MCFTESMLHLEHRIVKIVEYSMYAFAIQSFTVPSVATS